MVRDGTVEYGRVTTFILCFSRRKRTWSRMVLLNYHHVTNVSFMFCQRGYPEGGQAPCFLAKAMGGRSLCTRADTGFPFLGR
jgi:hypothetical protein